MVDINSYCHEIKIIDIQGILMAAIHTEDKWLEIHCLLSTRYTKQGLLYH